VSEHKNGIAYRVFKNPTKAGNEAWDLLFYAYALLWILSPDLSEVVTAEWEDDEDEWEDEDDVVQSDWMNG
ncbi:phage terminase large subunit family protein, partial [Streptomyces galilaeus]